MVNAKYTPAAFSVLQGEIATDEDYALSWHSNIAVAAMDEGVDWKTAQRIADRFMQAAFQTSTIRLVETSSPDDLT